MVSNHGNMCANNVADNKKVWPASLTAAEKEILVELALKYQAMIENQKSDEVTACLSCVQNANNNELSLSVIVEFYLTGHQLTAGQISLNLTVS